MKVYNKLVRDNIIEILSGQGLHTESYILEKDELYAHLRTKLSEEVEEFLRDDNIEELADIMEVVYALAKEKGTSKEQLEGVREEKAVKRGSFNKRIFLKTVD